MPCLTTFILDGVLTGTRLPLDNSSSLSPPPTGIRRNAELSVVLDILEPVGARSTFGHVAGAIEALRRPGGHLDKDGPRASIHLFDPVARRRTRDSVVDAYADQTEASAVSSRRWRPPVGYPRVGAPWAGGRSFAPRMYPFSGTVPTDWLLTTSGTAAVCTDYSAPCSSRGRTYDRRTAGAPTRKDGQWTIGGCTTVRFLNLSENGCG